MPENIANLIPMRVRDNDQLTNFSSNIFMPEIDVAGSAPAFRALSQPGKYVVKNENATVIFKTENDEITGKIKVRDIALEENFIKKTGTQKTRKKMQRTLTSDWKDRISAATNFFKGETNCPLPKTGLPLITPRKDKNSGVSFLNDIPAQHLRGFSTPFQSKPNLKMWLGQKVGQNENRIEARCGFKEGELTPECTFKFKRRNMSQVASPEIADEYIIDETQGIKLVNQRSISDEEFEQEEGNNTQDLIEEESNDVTNAKHFSNFDQPETEEDCWQKSRYGATVTRNYLRARRNEKTETRRPEERVYSSRRPRNSKAFSTTTLQVGNETMLDSDQIFDVTPPEPHESWIMYLLRIKEELSAHWQYLTDGGSSDGDSRPAIRLASKFLKNPDFFGSAMGKKGESILTIGATSKSINEMILKIFKNFFSRSAILREIEATVFDQDSNICNFMSALMLKLQFVFGQNIEKSIYLNYLKNSLEPDIQEFLISRFFYKPRERLDLDRICEVLTQFLSDYPVRNRKSERVLKNTVNKEKKQEYRTEEELED